MVNHRDILYPKFLAVHEALSKYIGTSSIAQWRLPKGGYFICIELKSGTASEVARLSSRLGIKLTSSGACFPKGYDPNNSVLRIAPSFPSLDEVKIAAEGLALSIVLACMQGENV
ncbi:MAG: hypothetical protein COB33_009985 [Thiotrichaceae bacterium]|nr:hypothetical protein [Thiotrichaceae bacterium]